MNKIISVKQNQDISKEIEKASAQYPVFMQDMVREAFQAADEGDFETADELCGKLLEYQEVEEIRALRGVCCFTMGDLERAEPIFKELTLDYPDTALYRIHLGMTYHGMGYFYKAVKELGSLEPLSEYHPFFYTSYGDCLQEIGKPKQSREAFRKEVEYF